MNLSTVGPTPDPTSSIANLFASNAEFVATTHTPWSLDNLGDRGGVRQDPPTDSFVNRRDNGLEPEPNATGDTDDDPTPVDGED